MEYSIAGAAQALGVSQNTVRRRLADGLLSGYKVKGKWVITLPNQSQTDGQEPEQSEQATLDSAMVGMLQARVDAQDVQLAAKDTQIAELHRLMAQTALNAATARPWWRFWG